MKNYGDSIERCVEEKEDQEMKTDKGIEEEKRERKGGRGWTARRKPMKSYKKIKKTRQEDVLRRKMIRKRR